VVSHPFRKEREMDGARGLHGESCLSPTKEKILSGYSATELREKFNSRRMRVCGCRYFSEMPGPGPTKMSENASILAELATILDVFA
jgi:hypothetical protein